MTAEILDKKAKKHKKLFESYKINQKHIHLNDKSFYMVFYTKFNRYSGFALICPEENVTLKDFDKALGKFAILNTNMKSVLKNGGERANINFEPFYQTYDFLGNVITEVSLPENQKPHYERCYNTLSNIIQLQKRLIEIYEEFKQIMNHKISEGFLSEDIDYVQSVLAEMDYIQYKQIRGNYEVIEDYEFIFNHINQHSEIRMLVTDEVKRYIKEFASNKRKTEDELRKITYVDNMEQLTKEEHMAVVKDKINREQEAGNVGLKKDLRYPKLN